MVDISRHSRKQEDGGSQDLMESQTENLWQNTTGRNIENRRPLLATKTLPGNERFIENSLAGERKFQLHQIGSEADNNTKCGQSGAELIITGSDKTKCEEISQY